MSLNAFALAMVLLASSPSAASAGNEEMKVAASGLLDRFAKAWSATDAHALAALFATDADFINPWGVKAEGRWEIEAFYAGAFRQGFAGSKGEGRLVAVRAVSPEFGLIDARWRITNAKMPDGSPRADEQGILVGLIEKTENGWRILAMRENASATDIVPLAQAR